LVKRSVNSPWGNVYKEGLPSTAVDDKTVVDQEVRPTINTGSIDVQTGKWTGVTLSDELFKGFTTHTVPNGASELFPVDETTSNINMTGFNDLFIAIKPTNGGNFATTAVMGPDTNLFGGLTPVNSGATLRYSNGYIDNQTMGEVVNDGVEALTANVWNIFGIQLRAKEQKNLQFKITNNSGGESDIEFAYLRLV